MQCLIRAKCQAVYGRKTTGVEDTCISLACCQKGVVLWPFCRTLSENHEQNCTIRGILACHWGGTLLGTVFIPLIMVGVKYVAFCPTKGYVKQP